MLPVGFSANLQCYADSPTAKRIQKSKSLVSECVLIYQKSIPPGLLKLSLSVALHEA